jgi:hypothetical protein
VHEADGASTWTGYIYIETNWNASAAIKLLPLGSGVDGNMDAYGGVGSTVGASAFTLAPHTPSHVPDLPDQQQAQPPHAHTLDRSVSVTSVDAACASASFPYSLDGLQCYGMNQTPEAKVRCSRVATGLVVVKGCYRRDSLVSVCVCGEGGGGQTTNLPQGCHRMPRLPLVYSQWVTEFMVSDRGCR